MKQKTIAETSVFKSNRSLATTIPSTIKNLEDLSNNKNIRWYYEIKNNKHIYTLEFIEKQPATSNTKTTKKTTSDIDKTTQKQQKQKKRISQKDDEPDDPTHQETFDELFDDETNEIMKELNRTHEVFITDPDETFEKQVERYEHYKSNKKHRTVNKDRTFIIAIQKKDNKKFKLNFKLNNRNKDRICAFVFNDGSLNETYQKLKQLSYMNQHEVVQFILSQNPSDEAKQHLQEHNMI